MESPWDTTPSTVGQQAYLRQLFEGLAQHDWSVVRRELASEIIDKVNTIRRSVGIPFRDYTDVDAASGGTNRQHCAARPAADVGQ